MKFKVKRRDWVFATDAEGEIEVFIANNRITISTDHEAITISTDHEAITLDVDTLRLVVDLTGVLGGDND